MGEQIEDRQSHFFTWLSKSVSPAQLSELYQAFSNLEEILSSHRYFHRLPHSLIETTNPASIDILYNDLSTNRQFLRSYKSGMKLSLLKHYARYCREFKADNPQSHDEIASTDDALIDRLKRDGIAYTDNRPNSGALWISKSLKTDALIREFKSQGVYFSFSEDKQQWWTRDRVTIAPPAQEIHVQAIVKRNKNGFFEWLQTQDYKTGEVFSIYGTARKIHRMLLAQGSTAGLFGVHGIENIRACAKSARMKNDFIQGDRQESGLWTTTLDNYLRFAENNEVSMEKKPEITESAAESKDQVNTQLQDKPAFIEPPQETKQPSTLTGEDDFRQWLKDNKPQVNADFIIAAIRSAEKFAQRTHMRSSKLLGIAPSVVKAIVNHLIVSKAFANSDARSYREFRLAAPLLIEYAADSLATPGKTTSSTQPADAEVHPSAVPEVHAEKTTDMESSLAVILQNEQFSVLRSALIRKGILSLNGFKQLNLWVFMNQNGLYSIGERQAVYSALQRAMTFDETAKTNTLWKIITLKNEYTGSAPAEALIAYCRAIAYKYPLKFRSLIGQPMNRSEFIPLLKFRLHAEDSHMDNPEVYISCETDANRALTIARWIGKTCHDDDVPQRITSDSPEKGAVQGSGIKAGSDTKKAVSGGSLIERIASLTSDEDYSFTKPVSVTYRGVTTPTDSWQKVYLEVCRHLYNDHTAQMLDLANGNSVASIVWQYANSQTKARFRLPKEFAPGCYFESNLSATDIMRRIRRLLQYFQASDRFVIRYQSQTSAITTKPESVPEKQPEKSPEKPVTPAQPVSVSPLQKKVEELVLAADLEGMTLDQLYSQIPSVTMVALKQIRDNSLKLVDIADRLIHKDAFVDWDEGAQKLEEILEKLLTKNNGYVSYSQLYEYARAEMQMFLNDNDMDDPRKVYDMAEHLFEKEGYHGKRYTFWMKAHISRGNESVTSNLGVIRKFARDHNGFFRYDDLVEYLEQVGIKTANLRGQMQLGIKPIFFYYSSDGIIFAETMKIDESWLDQVEKALKRLFADVGDHVILRSINPIWYEQLPALPGYLPWTPLLLQYILQFYGKKLNAKTIGSELSQKYDVLHAMLVTPDSEIQTFADAVVAYLVDAGIPEREFEAEELRGRLVDGGLIAGNELIWHMPKAIGSDPRFAWNASGGKVRIKV